MSHFLGQSLGVPTNAFPLSLCFRRVLVSVATPLPFLTMVFTPQKAGTQTLFIQSKEKPKAGEGQSQARADLYPSLSYPTTLTVKRIPALA